MSGFRRYGSHGSGSPTEIDTTTRASFAPTGPRDTNVVGVVRPIGPRMARWPTVLRGTAALNSIC
jgi:hypothetical protein